MGGAKRRTFCGVRMEILWNNTFHVKSLMTKILTNFKATQAKRLKRLKRVNRTVIYSYVYPQNSNSPTTRVESFGGREEIARTSSSLALQKA